MSKKFERTPDMLEKPCLHPDHPKPVTRRQFLAAGLIPAGGYLVLPGLLSRYFTPTMREAIASGATPPDTKLVFINLAGGSNIGHHVIGTGKGGALPNGTGDFSISAAGLAGHAVTQVAPVSTLGLPLNPNSVFTQALLGVNGGAGMLTAAAAAQTRGAVHFVASQDDTSSNAMAFADWAAAAHAKIMGHFLLPALGVKSSASGVGMTNASGASANPLVVKNAASLTAAVGLGGLFGTAGFTTAQQQAVLNGPAGLGAVFPQAITKFLRGQEFGTLVQNAANANQKLLSSPPNTLAANDTTVAPIWNTTGASFPATSNAANIVFNVMKGNAPVGGVEIGGCDYHNQGATTFASVHVQTAEMVAKTLNTAAALGVNAMVVVITDGATNSSLTSPTSVSVTGSAGNAFTATDVGQADGDQGNNGANLTFFLKSGSSGGSQYINGASTNVALGSLITSSGQVDTTSPLPNGAPNIGASPKQFAATVFMNWLNTMGQAGLFSSFAGNVLPQTTAQQYLVYM